MDRGASDGRPRQRRVDLEGSAAYVGVDAWVRSLLTILEVKNVAARQEDNERFICPGVTPGYRGLLEQITGVQ